jgi:hypothetical protein
VAKARIPDGAATISGLADLSGRPIAEVYRLMRLPLAPSPTGHAARVRYWAIPSALAYLSADQPRLAV